MLYKVLLELTSPGAAASGIQGRGPMRYCVSAATRTHAPNDRKEQSRHVGVICHKVTTLRPFVDCSGHRVAQEANNG